MYHDMYLFSIFIFQCITFTLIHRILMIQMGSLGSSGVEGTGVSPKVSNIVVLGDFLGPIAVSSLNHHHNQPIFIRF